jgi:anhydro-N-acetylmuramic acid kinase
VLGIMSGTSIDGVDYALCRCSDREMALLALWRARFPQPLQRRIHAAARGEASSWDVAQLHHDLGRFYAKHAHDQSSQAPELVGLHGQTIFHHPDAKTPPPCNSVN